MLHLHRQPASLRSGPLTLELIQSIAASAPPIPIYRPQVDISSTLSYLEQVETSTSAPLAPLQQKLAFLLAMVCFLRPSDLHRISLYSALVDSVCGSLTFTVVAPKERRKSRRILKPFTIYPLANSALCPVYTFICVRDHRLLLSRRPQNVLFVNAKQPRKPVTISTIGTWLRNLIKMSTQEPGVSVRSLASSIALHHGIPLDDIVTLGNWSSSTTFHNHYRRQHMSMVDFSRALLGSPPSSFPLVGDELFAPPDDEDIFYDAQATLD